MANHTPSTGKVFKLLIAPVGNPKDYNNAKYRFPGKEPVEAKTPLMVLAKELRPDIVAVVVGDSAGINHPNYRPGDQYPQLVEFSQELVKGLLPDVENLVIGVMPNKGNFKISFRNQTEQSPSAGKVGGESSEKKEEIDEKYLWKYEFRSEIEDHRLLLFHFIAQLLVDNRVKEAEKVEIFIDTTHGINFMTTLTVQQLRKVAGMLSFFKDVELIFYNSDPYQPEVVMDINLIEREKVEPVLPKWWLVREKGEDTLVSRNGKKWGNFILGGFYHRLPLVIATGVTKFPLKSVVAQIEAEIDRVMVGEVSKDTSTATEKEKGTVVYRRPNRLKQGFEELTAATFLATHTLNQFPTWEKAEGYRWEEIEKLGALLKELAIDVELKKIRRNWEKSKAEYAQGYYQLAELYSYQSNNSSFRCRNFLAHKGFERNVTLFATEKGELHFKYELGNNTDKILNCLHSN